MSASWGPDSPAGVLSAGESGASAGLLVLLAALVAGTVALVLLLVVTEVFRRRGGDDDVFDVRALWRKAAEEKESAPLATPYLDEARRRMDGTRRHPGGGEDLPPSNAPAPAPAPPAPSRWTAASQDVAWRENGRRDAFPEVVVRETEERERAKQAHEAELASPPVPDPGPEPVPPVAPGRRGLRRRQAARAAAPARGRRSKSAAPRIPRAKASTGRLVDKGSDADGSGDGRRARRSPAAAGRAKGSLGRLARLGRGGAPRAAAPATAPGPAAARENRARTGRPKPSRARVGVVAPAVTRLARRRTSATVGQAQAVVTDDRVVDLRRIPEQVAARAAPASPVVAAAAASPVVSAPAPPVVVEPEAPESPRTVDAPAVAAPSATPEAVDTAEARASLRTPPPALPVTPVVFLPEEVPLVRLTVDTLQRAVRVAVVRDRLRKLRSEAPPAAGAAGSGSLWEARAARACLLSLVPLLLAARALSPDWPGQGERTPSAAAGLVAFVLLAGIGSVWTWRVTAPPYLHFPGRERARQRAIVRDSSSWEQVAVRLAAGFASHDAWRASSSRPDEVAGARLTDTTLDAAVRAIRELRADMVREPGRLEGQVSTVTLLPFVTCLAPAIVLAVML